MAWPTTPLPVTVEMFTDEWVDITDRVRVEGGITLRHGVPDEGSTTEPEASSIAMTVDNRDGHLSPRNPVGNYYGKIGRNTPVRVLIGEGLCGAAYVALAPSGMVWSPSVSPVEITGDIDIRIDVVLDAWHPVAAFASKWNANSNQRSWHFTTAAGFLVLTWSPDGTEGAAITATSTVVAGFVGLERKALRATLDVDNGAGGWTVTFYTADTISGTWVQLGDPVTDTGTTSIFNSTADVTIGQVPTEEDLALTGRVYALEIRDGIAGSVVAQPDFTSRDVGDTFFIDASLLGWTIEPVAGTARIEDPSIRALDEVSEWPPRWDKAGVDVTVPLVAQGVLRRLRQGRAPSRSPLRAGIQAEAYGLGAQSLVGYWPMEDLGGSFAADPKPSAGLEGLLPASAMTYSGEAPEFAATGAFLGSDSVALLAATTSLLATVPAFDDRNFAARMILDVPASPGWADGTVLLRLPMDPGSSMGFWEVHYKSGGALLVRTLDHFGSQLATSGTLSSFAVHGQSLWLGLDVTQDGVAADWRLYMRVLDDDGVTVVESATSTSTFVGAGQIGHPVQVRIAPGGGLGGLGVGHVVISGGTSATAFGDNYVAPTTGVAAVASFVGETAAARAERLAGEVEIALRIVGAVAGTQTMGAQATPGTWFGAFSETIAAELALAHETRDELGLTWRTLASRHNQGALTLAYNGPGEVAELEPTDDDQGLVNDVEVRRKAGSSARAIDLTSRMGILPPPDGVGRYETSVEVNVDSDDVVLHHAGWLLHLGTCDEQRYPKVVLDLAALGAAGKTDLIEKAAQLRVGDRIVITNLPTWLPPENADLACLWFEEFLGPFEWKRTITCVPYSPYQVGVVAEETPLAVDSRVQRADGDDLCALRTAVDDNDTSLVFDPNNARYTTDTDDYDTDLYPQMYWVVGGERMAVTAMATTAATFVAVGAASHADNAAVTPAMYAGSATGDRIFVAARVRDTAATLSIGSDYTLMRRVGGLYLWAKVHDGSEPDPTVTPSGGGAGDTVTAFTFGFRNMSTTLEDLADGIVLSAGKVNGSGQNINYPRLRRPGTDGCVVLIVAGKSDDYTSVAVPSGFTELIEASTTTGDDQAMYVAYQIQTSAAQVLSRDLQVTGGAAAVSEAMVLAIAGGYQTATVTRSQNARAIAKSHAVGARIALYQPIRAVI